MWQVLPTSAAKRLVMLPARLGLKAAALAFRIFKPGKAISDGSAWLGLA